MSEQCWRNPVGAHPRVTGATHVAVATDHVIESFRNELYDGYKDGSGIDPVLFAQFPLLEDAQAPSV